MYSIGGGERVLGDLGCRDPHLGRPGAVIDGDDRRFPPRVEPDRDRDLRTGAHCGPDRAVSVERRARAPVMAFNVTRVRRTEEGQPDPRAARRTPDPQSQPHPGRATLFETWRQDEPGCFGGELP